MSWEAPSQDVSTESTTALPTSGGFAELGVPKALVSALHAGWHHRAVPDPGRHHPRRARRPGRARPRPDGIGQDARFRAADDHQPVRPNAPSGCARALVLVPTRELALQVADVLAPLARIQGLSLTLVAGGMPYGPQLKAFERGVDIVVATPGRLIDLMDQGAADLDPGRGRRAGRGRPHGRPGLHARGDPDPRHRPGRGPATAVLGHPRRGRQPPGQALPLRPGHPRGRLGPGQRRLDGAPRAPGPAVRQGRHDRRDRRPGRPYGHLRPHPARRRPGRRAAPRGGRARRCAARRTDPGRARPDARLRSRTAVCPCWSPPTSPPAGSTSTRSVWSSRSTRRPDPRTTCTAPVVRPGPARPGSS